MGYYKSPADMFSSRADRFKRDGDRHWLWLKTAAATTTTARRDSVTSSLP